MPFYEREDVRIRYEEAGSGFPLLVTPAGLKLPRQQLDNRGVQRYGGIQARLPLHHDGPAQRERRRVQRTDPVNDPWGAFADDQLG